MLTWQLLSSIFQMLRRPTPSLKIVFASLIEGLSNLVSDRGLESWAPVLPQRYEIHPTVQRRLEVGSMLLTQSGLKSWPPYLKTEWAKVSPLNLIYPLQPVISQNITLCFRLSLSFLKWYEVKLLPPEQEVSEKKKVHHNSLKFTGEYHSLLKN